MHERSQTSAAPNTNYGNTNGLFPPQATVIEPKHNYVYVKLLKQGH